MEGPTDRDRIVMLEAQRQHQIEWNAEVIDELKQIKTDVKVISSWIQKKTGFIGGIVFCVGIMAAMIGAVASHLWKTLTENH